MRDRILLLLKMFYEDFTFYFYTINGVFVDYQIKNSSNFEIIIGKKRAMNKVFFYYKKENND